MQLGSAEMTDEQFLKAVESCRLPLDRFRHGDHLRLAWLYIRRYTADEALSRVKASIRRYASHHGLDHIYHETVTTAWVKLIATHSETTFEEFLSENRNILASDLLGRHWTREALKSEEARRSWIEPDKAALPSLRR